MQPFFPQGSAYLLKIVSSSEKILSPPVLLFIWTSSKSSFTDRKPSLTPQIKAPNCTIYIMFVLLLIASEYTQSCSFFCVLTLDVSCLAIYTISCYVYRQTHSFKKLLFIGPNGSDACAICPFTYHQ